MKARSVKRGGYEWLCIRHFGMEDIESDAKWGTGTRDVFVFHYILSGKGYFNGIPVGKHQGFVIRANELTEYHADPKEPWQYFWVIFEGTSAEEICQKHINADENHIFTYDFAEALQEIMGKLFSSAEALSQTQGLAFFFHLLSLHEEKTTRKGNRYVSDAKNYMYLHLHQPMAISDVAAVLGISDRYLYNLFIKYEGIAPKKYLMNLRLQNAENLLKNSRYTVTEIASAVGFPDVLAFSRFFSKMEGISPSVYRKKG